MRSNPLMLIVVLAGCAVAAHADLGTVFADFDTVWEVGVSGLRSSYAPDTLTGAFVTGDVISTELPEFGPQRVSYPGGVGEVPSPGGAIGRYFDQGAIGVRVADGLLVIQLATGLDPYSGYYHNGWHTWYGQGDVFLTVADSLGITHYALLNTWARTPGGSPIPLNGGHFSDAMEFHVGGEEGADNLEGHLVALSVDADVTGTGGAGSYHSGNAPAGLDRRVFAGGGTDLGDANLNVTTLSDFGQTWYIESWTLPLDLLSADGVFELALHAAPSCGNDQIGANFVVPEPQSAMTILLGLAWLTTARRRG